MTPRASGLRLGVDPVLCARASPGSPESADLSGVLIRPGLARVLTEGGLEG